MGETTAWGMRTNGFDSYKRTLKRSDNDFAAECRTDDSEPVAGNLEGENGMPYSPDGAETTPTPIKGIYSVISGV